MVRFIVTAVALAGFLATAHPTLADPAAAMAPDQAQAAAPARQEPVMPEAGRAASDARMPARNEPGIGIPVGFGWS